MKIGIVSSLIATLISNLIFGYINYKNRIKAECEEYLKYIKIILFYLSKYMNNQLFKDQVVLKIEDRPFTFTLGGALNKIGEYYFSNIETVLNKISELCKRSNKYIVASQINETIELLDSFKLEMIENKDKIYVNYMVYLLKFCSKKNNLIKNEEI